MNYIDTINGYEIYEYSKGLCCRYGLSYPCYGAYLPESDHIPDYEECSMETFEELAEWCEKN